MKPVPFVAGVFLLLLCTACGSCGRPGTAAVPAPGFGPTEGVPAIRVALSRNADSLSIALSSPYAIQNAATSKVVSQGASLPRTRVTCTASMFVLGPTRIKSDHIIIIPKNDGSLTVNNRQYRGTLHLWAKEGKLTAVNHVNLEHYLASVVPSEMKMSWPDAALQAQAVAARTYALWRMQQPAARKRTWDLTSGPDSQVYRGLDKESKKSRKIVTDTAGIVLTYEGKIFPTYYHSTCGGFTADAHVVFGGEEIPCLTGVPCGNCQHSPVYEWTFFLTQEELQKIVKKAGTQNVGKIKEIERVEPDGSERPQQVVLHGEKADCRLQTPRFRKLVGTSRMKSTAFRVEKLGDSFKILGSGWGHGVGMCQWGAAGMADPQFGFTAQEILQHYYQDSELQRLY